MSALLELLNVIKTQHTRDWLTPSQRLAVRAAEEHLRIPMVVNLAGGAGCGKTFCGWILAHSLDAPVVTDPACLPNVAALTNGSVVVDNVPDDLQILRGLLTELQLRRVRRAVFISHYENELGLPTVPLPAPSATDCAHILQQISIRYPFYPGAPCDNLWTWIRSAAA